MRVKRKVACSLAFQNALMSRNERNSETGYNKLFIIFVYFILDAIACVWLRTGASSGGALCG